MMIRGSSSKEVGDSQVDAKNSDEKKKSSTSTTIGSNSSSTSSWHRLKDPRIVRVSRAFGGKDRHSKVCTVRGLRDRRVRLSVPTAIQLYDLQDRLGLSQPSKVVDWLLNAAKDEIDELPPLQMPPLGFPTQNHQQPTQQQQPNKEQLVEAVPSLYQWEPNSFPLSYMGFMMSQSQDARHANTSMQPSTLSLSSGSHPDYFPLLENNHNDPRLQMQLLHHMRPNFQLSKDQQHHHFPDSK